MKNRTIPRVLAAVAALVLPLSADTITYDFSDGHQSWTQIFPTEASGLDMWGGDDGTTPVLGSGYDPGDTRFGRSPEFYLDGSGPLGFDLLGGQSELAGPFDTDGTTLLSPDAIPELAITDNGGAGGFAGVALRDVAANTYLLWKRRTGSGGAAQYNEFTVAELAPYANDGKLYTLDYIDYNKGGWGWTYLDNVSIPGTLGAPPVPANLSATAGATAVTLTWDASQGASSYKIFRSTTMGSGHTQIGTSIANSYTDPSLAATPYYYYITAANSGGESAATDEVSATPSGATASADNDILTMSLGDDFGTATINGTLIQQYVPTGTDVSALTVSYTTSPFATGNPETGSTLDLTFPQTITITAEDGTSTQDYTIRVNQVSSITYDFSDGLQGWTQVFPTLPGWALWGGGGFEVDGTNQELGSGFDDGETRLGESPEFYLLNSGPLTFQLRGGQSEQDMPVAPSAIPELAITDADGGAGGFAGVALRDVAADTYVLWKRRTGNSTPQWQPNEFSAAELAPYANDGKLYALDYIDYNKGGWGWTYLDNVSIPGTTTEPGTEGVLTSLSIGSDSYTEINGTDVTVWLPAGTDVTALTPVLSISPEATVSPDFGVAQNFSSPVAYTVTSGDTNTSNVYTVTVVTAGGLAVKGYDNDAADTNLNPISNLQGITESGSGVQVGDINYSDDFVGAVPGITGLESFSVLWEGWFDVTVDGPGDYTFATRSDDGSVLFLDLNNDGDFGDPGELVVDNNGNHGLQNRLSTVFLPMDSVRIAIAFYEAGGGQGMQARFGKGTNLAFDSLQFIGGRTAHFQVSQPATNPASAALWYFNHLSNIATPYLDDPQTLVLNLPQGSSTVFNPDFVVSPGATATPMSGSGDLDFSTPQMISVTSQDSTTTTNYTVFARVAQEFQVRVYDGINGTTYLDPIDDLFAFETPTATGTELGDINYTSDAAFQALPGLAAKDPVNNFTVAWDGWFNVAADGPGDYTFGTRSDDGSVLYLDFNNDGDFDDPGELVVDNNAVQGATTRTASVKLPMDKIRFAVGYFEVGGGNVIEARFRKGANLAWEDMDYIGGGSGLFSNTEPADNPSSAALWNLADFDNFAVPTNPACTEFLLQVPLGEDITSLAPTFVVSPGATSVPVSGTTLDFSVPQTYTVTSQDTGTVVNYTVTAVNVVTYDFDTDLDGWNNRVWDLSANGGAGGWIDLAPNSSAMPSTINDGAIQPPSVDNGLFGNTGGEVYPNGQTDNHLNTLWLRSPEFTLDATGVLRVDLNRGIAYGAAPTDDASVPHEAITNDGTTGGWKGVALRRVSDGAFVLTAARDAGNSATPQTVTFSAAQLAPFDGELCTLDLINTDRGGWGWITMDNVVIPTTGLVPLSDYDAWRADHPELVGAFAGPNADADGDGSANIVEWGFGTDPGSAVTGPIAFTGDILDARGAPVIDMTGTPGVIFGRLFDYQTFGLTYTVELSADLENWVDHAGTPTTVAFDATVDAVRVEFPATIDPGSGPVTPRFARIRVEN